MGWSRVPSWVWNYLSAANFIVLFWFGLAAGLLMMFALAFAIWVEAELGSDDQP